MESFREILKVLPIPERLRENVETIGIIRKYWEELLGKDLAQKTKPVKYENGTLVVEVPDFYHFQLLQLIEGDLIKKIRKVINKDIRLKLKINPKIILKNKELVETKRHTDQEEIKRKAKKICISIEDEDLRKEFFKLLTRYFSLKRNI